MTESESRAEPYDFRKRLAVAHQPDVRDPRLRPKPEETRITDSWCIAVRTGGGPLRDLVAEDLRDYFSVSMGMDLPLREIGDDVEPPERSIVLESNWNLAQENGQNRQKRYRLIVDDVGVRIDGIDDRSIAQGVYHIEDLMNLRRAPFLPIGEAERKSLFSPRMVHSGWALDEYPDCHLNSIAHAGFDAIMVFAKGVDLTPLGPLDFNDLVERAEHFGLDVYFYSYLKSLKHPNEPGARAYYEETYGELFHCCPGARGLILVGESCEFPSEDPNTTGTLRSQSMNEPGVTPDKPSPGWWPCFDYPLWLNMIKDVVRGRNPEADIVFWTYNWGWAPVEDRLALIENLPDDATLQVTFEMFDQIRRSGVVHVCVDYTLSNVGPGKYFVSEAEAASKRGLRLYTMSNTAGLTWDFGCVPFEPFPAQWFKRFNALLDARRRWGLSGLMEGHHYGFFPSLVNELAKWAFWTPTPDLESVLAAIVERDFGKRAKSRVLGALGYWSEAIEHYIPTNEDQYGPFRVGPAYPFIFQPDVSKTFGPQEIVFPSDPGAHFGHRIIKTFYHPFEDARQSPGATRINVEIRELTKMGRLMKKGLTRLESARGRAAGVHLENLQRLIALGRFIANSITTTVNVKNWYLLNRKLLLTSKPERALTLLGKLNELGEREIRNAEATIPVVETDSRLGWEPSMEYVCDRRRLEWKIKQMRNTLDVQIAAYRESLELT